MMMMITWNIQVKFTLTITDIKTIKKTNKTKQNDQKLIGNGNEI